MHKALMLLTAQLGKTVATLESAIPSDDPLGVAHGNWSFPCVTRSELVEEVQLIIQNIEDGGTDDIGDHEELLKSYIDRLSHLQQQTIPHIWGNASQAVPAFMVTMDGLRKALMPVLRPDGRAEIVAQTKKLSGQLRSLQARLNELEPRTISLDKMVADIEKAHNAADQLPTDLETLNEARKDVHDLLKFANADASQITSMRDAIEKANSDLNERADEARSILQRCETAYAASTSVGLAAAFSERSDKLSTSMWFWIAGLILALATGGVFGTSQIVSLTELFAAQSAPSSAIVLNVSLAVLSVGAPIWFAWLSTKQIGQRFRLSEDYAYKASIARAYEGFRREASRVDPKMEARLLATALGRLEELPLRLVETTTHGSPWHELATSETVREAFKLVPGFGERVKEFASQSLSAVNPSSKIKAGTSREKAE